MVSRLIVFRCGEEITTVVLDRERVRLGRKPHNDLTLPHFTVSGEHAVVTTMRSDAFIEDLNSTNGTSLNGRLITKKRLLHDGDEIAISPYVLHYVHDEPFAAALTGEKPRPTHDHASTKLYPKEAVSTGSDVLPLGVLRILSGPTAGRELELTRPLTMLGKPGIQVAAIARRRVGYDFVCVEGDDYPLVNEVPVDSGTSVILAHWDTVELAGVKMKFLLKRPCRTDS